MPHEVYIVDGHKREGSGLTSEVEDAANESRSEVSLEIGRIYNEVEEAGGEIVGSHVIPNKLRLNQGAVSEYVLYLVAKLPEEKPSRF